MPTSTNDPPQNDDHLLSRISEKLIRIGCQVRNLWISKYSDELILHGEVATYQAKQVVQLVAMEVSGRPVMSNELEVK